MITQLSHLMELITDILCQHHSPSAYCKHTDEVCHIRVFQLRYLYYFRFLKKLIKTTVYHL